MNYLKGCKVKRILTDRGICHTIHYEDYAPTPVAFDVKVYESDQNAYEVEVYLNGLFVHKLRSYTPLYETFVYCDHVISEIVEKQLGLKPDENL